MSRKWVSLTGGTWVGSSWGLETLRVHCGPGQCSPVTVGGVKAATCVRVGVLTLHACGVWLQLGSAESPVTTRPAGRCGHGLSLLQPHQAQGFPCQHLAPACSLQLASGRVFRRILTLLPGESRSSL